MLFLLDTTAFSDLMRENPEMASRLAALAPTDQVGVCPVVRGEILHGLARFPPGQRKQDLHTKAAALFAAIPCQPISEFAADQYAEVKLTRQKQGLALDENDLWIAASARQAGATLVTRDTGFRQIDGLRVEDWTR